MIDELYKDRMDGLWDRLARQVARSGLTPNGVTWIGFGLCFFNSLAFVFHQNYWLFGVAAGLIELLDNLDGAMARVTDQSSSVGAFLDSVSDRYKDAFILLAVAQVTGAWLPATLALMGSLITSYVAARADVLGATGRKGGLPDLFERLERIAVLCIGLVLTPFVPKFWGLPLIVWVLWLLAAMTHITAGQRFIRRWRQLKESDDARR
ncbi:MAG: CDP-alcohol phosphatidyltransferase family protein [Myxococcota bacterium]